MTVVTKKVTDALGAQFDVPFWQDGSYFYPMQQPSSVGVLPKLFYRFADLNGDGTGVYDLTGDYSGVADIAYVQPPAGSILRLTRMIIYIRDNGQFNASNYGNRATLTNGISVRVQNDSGTILNLTAQETVVTNAGWGSNCYDVDLKEWGSGDKMLMARWTFERAGYPIRLDGDNNERFEIVLNDDFTDLVNHAFNLQGYWEVAP